MPKVELKREPQKERILIGQIVDRRLRNVLISTVLNVEKLMAAGKVTPTTPMAHALPYGLTIQVSMDYKGPDKPTVYTFTYHVDRRKMAQWLAQNALLTEDILSFVGKGIEITVPPGENKAAKTGFSIDGPDGEREWLFVDSPVVQFRVQRDVFGGNEWVCMYVE